MDTIHASDFNCDLIAHRIANCGTISKKKTMNYINLIYLRSICSTEEATELILKINIP